MIDPISWAYSWPYLLTALAAGYALGSIPFGFILTRMFGVGDIRHVGSGNIGATNVLRTGKKGLAALTLALDAGKGAAAVLLGSEYGQDIAIVAAAGAMLGHLCPVWLMFRGGKGVATALGILLSLSPFGGILTCATWLLTAFLFRYSSLAALISLASCPVWLWLAADRQRMEFGIALAAVIWIRHWSNIRRLIRNEEPRIRFSGKF